MYGLLVLLCAAVACFAQFRDLATTDSGDQLLFATSHRARGSGQPFHGKIFLLGPAGLQAHQVVPEEPLDVFSRSNFFDLGRPDVNGDGAVEASTGRRICVGGSRCVFVEYLQATASDRGFPGYLRLSRNGRYALNYGATVPLNSPSLVDLQSGAKYTLPRDIVIAPKGRVVSSTGAAVVTDTAGRVWLYTLEGSREIATRLRGRNAVLDESASTVVYGAFPTADASWRLHLVDLISGTERELIACAGGCNNPILTNDGQRVLFLAAIEPGGPLQAAVVNRDGSGVRYLTADPSGIEEAVLSGDGNVVWLVTRAGRLYRIDVESGRTEERLANTPTPSQSLDSGVPGSTYHLAGTGFSAGTAVAQPPLPRSLAGLRVLLNGQPMPLLVVSPGEVRFQVPWDTAPSSSNMLSIEPGSDVELEPPPLNLPVTDFEARLPGYPQPNVVPSEAFLSPAHQNFESLVTAHQPAQPGEIIHLFGTGFGLVVAPPPTGERGMSPTVRPVECTSSSGPVETVYSGLAPSMVGYYQISLRLPDTLKAPAVYLQCTGFYGMIHTTGS